LFSPLKKVIPKALPDGYLQEVKRLASKQISIRQGGFTRKSWIITINHWLKIIVKIIYFWSQSLIQV